MSSGQNVDIKHTIAKVVSSVMASSKGAKSTGVIIATIKRDVENVVIQPFSL